MLKKGRLDVFPDQGSFTRVKVNYKRGEGRRGKGRGESGLPKAPAGGRATKAMGNKRPAVGVRGGESWPTFAARPPWCLGWGTKNGRRPRRGVFVLLCRSQKTSAARTSFQSRARSGGKVGRRRSSPEEVGFTPVKVNLGGEPPRWFLGGGIVINKVWGE